MIVLATDLSGIPKNLRAFKDLGVAVLNLPALDGCRPFQEGSRGLRRRRGRRRDGAVGRDDRLLRPDPRRGHDPGRLPSVSIAPELERMFHCFRRPWPRPVSTRPTSPT